MTTNPDNFGQRNSMTGSEQYLDASIRTATPARLRLMLLDRSVEVAQRIADCWKNGEAKGCNEHSLRLLDILNELLGGITGAAIEAENKVCQQVADLYVFLTKHLILAEETSDYGAVEEIRTVLEVEAETWRAVCAQEAPAPRTSTVSAPVSGGLNFEA
ncbi:MAG: flagellar export chaperone FliS [Rubripirellula sp.]